MIAIIHKAAVEAVLNRLDSIDREANRIFADFKKIGERLKLLVKQ